jgi:hypothetical protein
VILNSLFSRGWIEDQKCHKYPECKAIGLSSIGTTRPKSRKFPVFFPVIGK